MQFTKLAQLYDNRPELFASWREFVEALSEPVITPNKHAPWMYSAAVFIPGTTRGNGNVLYCSMLIADIDSSSEETVVELLNTVEEMKIQCFFHTTHSYIEGLKQGKFKCRFLFPVNRKIEPDEWDAAWAGFAVFLKTISGVVLDPKCKDAPHAYFAPSAERLEDCLQQAFDGFELDVDVLIELAPPEALKTTTFTAPPPELLKLIESSTRYRLAKQLLAALPPAIEGDGGDQRTFVAACVGRDYALTEEEFWPALQEFNDRCKPKWNEKELRKKLKNAYKYAKLPAGWRLVGQEQDDIINEDDIEKFCTKLGKRMNTESYGRMMRSMLAGEALASHDPDTTLERIGTLLGQRFPNAAPKQIASIFEPCIEKTKTLKDKKNRDVTLEALMVHIRTAQEDHHAKTAAERMQIHDSLSLIYALAFRAIHVPRATPYTEDEIQEQRKRFDRAVEFDKSWIVRHKDSFYFRVLDRYVGPYGKDAWNSCSIFLSPVPGLSLYEITPQGRRPRSMSALVEEYGMIANDVIIDMTAQKSVFRHHNFQMVEATCPVRQELKPKQHKNVDKWLSLFCGGDGKLYNRLLDWLATLLKLHQPTAALIVYGKAQTGKSLLAAALARLFTTGAPTEIEDVVGNFNSKLSKCPIVVADETVPKDGREPNTRLLRKLLTQFNRTFKRKFIPDADIVGCIRLIMTANNLEGLISFENITEHDIEAICERFLLIKIETDATKQFLEGLSKTEREEITHFSAIAEHVLWLRDNRKVETGSRMLVEGMQDSELSDALRSGTGVRPEVIEFVATWLCGTKKLQRQEHQPLVHKLPDETMAVLMTVHTLKEHWRALVNDHVPRLQNLSKALEALSIGQYRYKTRNYWQLDMPRILKFATGKQNFDMEELRQGMVNLGLLPDAPPGTVPIR